MYMTKYFFIRHGQLVEPYINHLTMDYEILADLSTSTLNPSININAHELFIKQTTGIDLSGVQTIYYNDSNFQSKRSYESAILIKDILSKQSGRTILLKGLPELREARFDVRQLLSKDEFKRGGMPAIRTALYAGQIHGTEHTESIADISVRIKKIVDIINNQPNSDMLFVTHDFFMRVIEVYITREERLNQVTVNDLEQTGLNYYFGGFYTDQKMHKFTRCGKEMMKKNKQ